MTIYDTHSTAFNNINAYVIAENSEKYGINRLATIAFKRGATGNVKCFFHVIGQEMVTGNAGGGGYDKLSAAFYDAARKHLKNMQQGHKPADDLLLAERLHLAALGGNGSSHWHNELRNAGFPLLQAV